MRVLLVHYLAFLILLPNNPCCERIQVLKQSPFFARHEVVGSSLLFVYDDKRCGLWLIDFGKTQPLPDGVTGTHERHWEEGSHADGYLLGYENLMSVWKDV